MTKKVSTTKKVAAGMGITAAIAAAAAGAYFLYGTEEGKKQRKKLSAWSMKMKKEMTEKLGKIKDMNEEKYREVIDSVAERYKKLKEVEPQEVAKIARELKAHWKNIKREFNSGKRKVRSMGKKKGAAKSRSR